MSNPYTSDTNEVEHHCFEYFQKAGLDEREAKIAVESVLSLYNILEPKPTTEELPRIYQENFEEKFEKLESEFEALRPADKHRLKSDILEAVGRGLEGELTGPLTAPVEVALAGLDDPPDHAYSPGELPDTYLTPPGIEPSPDPSESGFSNHPEPATTGASADTAPRLRGDNSVGISESKDSGKELLENAIETVDSSAIRKEITRELYHCDSRSLTKLQSEIMARIESSEQDIHDNLDFILDNGIARQVETEGQHPEQYSLTELGKVVAEDLSLD